MNIQHISSDDLRRMPDKEGLVIMGCGGDPQEWVDGINGMLAEDGILRDGVRFENVSVFEHKGLTCLLFHFDNVKLDVGRLAMWRLRTHEHFGGTWLSDFVPNRLGGYLREKTDCPLIGKDGSISGLAGIAARVLWENGMEYQAQEMKKQHKPKKRKHERER